MLNKGWSGIVKCDIWNKSAPSWAPTVLFLRATTPRVLHSPEHWDEVRWYHRTQLSIILIMTLHCLLYWVYYTGSTVSTILCLVDTVYWVEFYVLTSHFSFWFVTDSFRPEPAGVVLTWGLLNVSSSKLESGHYEFQWLGLKGKFSIFSYHCAVQNSPCGDLDHFDDKARKAQKLYYRGKILFSVYWGLAWPGWSYHREEWIKNQSIMRGAAINDPRLSWEKLFSS